ncbi:MAG: bifunctional 4-hydroxy-2-oxoglutarate aldolase/2-dehydro-3-deoxy-phosphogluconate aldolase [Planctomycetota bacterium]
MERAEIFEKLAQHAVIPVLSVERPERALGLADALVAGGLPVAEVALRTDAAAEAIRLLRRARPNMILGAGTVLSAAQVELARVCGAQFLVSPGVNRDVVRRASELGVPMIPGVFTPSEIELALSLGADVLKVFPAEVGGGVRLIQALAGPYRHTGVRFVPTGGITTANLESYLKEDIVLAVGGTWIAKKDDIAEERWAEVTRRCEETRAIVARVRGGGPA